MQRATSQRTPSAIGASVLIAISAHATAAKPHWDNTIGQPGVDSFVFALEALPESDLVAGGWFTTAGGQTVNRIARWDGSDWHPLKSGDQIGVDGTVNALTVYDGDLIAGGFSPRQAGRRSTASRAGTAPSGIRSNRAARSGAKGAPSVP